jgi:hypothetical protein
MSSSRGWPRLPERAFEEISDAERGSPCAQVAKIQPPVPPPPRRRTPADNRSTSSGASRWQGPAMLIRGGIRVLTAQIRERQPRRQLEELV